MTAAAKRCISRIDGEMHPRSGIDSYVDSEERAEKFLALTKRYTDFTELTTPMLNEFISRVVVHERADKKCRYTEQKVEIHLNFIGEFIIPPEAIEPLDAEEEAKLAHGERVQKRRQYYRDYYRKRQENGGKPLRPEETAELKAERHEKLKTYHREYQRERRKKAAENKVSA